ncbi:MAG: hypothetical protein Sapg2KO_27660 [Saprospiraceae bacterium]
MARIINKELKSVGTQGLSVNSLPIKILIPFVIFILMNTPGFSQNILEALQLKNDSIGEYVIGELRASDTIVDLRNGYYEEFYSFEGDDKHIIRQAAIFHNQDGSRTLGISIAEYDFVCFYDKTDFYEISKSKDSIHPTLKEDLLPDLNFREFVKDTTISVLNKYLPKLQENYLDSNATIDKLLSEIYYISYILPQWGTTLIVTLGACDYIPRNEISINSDDWSIIENEILSIELVYDKIEKKFKKR